MYISIIPYYTQIVESVEKIFCRIMKSLNKLSEDNKLPEHQWFMAKLTGKNCDLISWNYFLSRI